MIAGLETTVIGGSVVVALMFALWLIHLAMRNASIVDVGWAASLGVLAILYALRAPGHPVRAWVIAAMVAVWSLRLATHLLGRILGKPEEGRYVQLRKGWGTNVALKFFFFFEFQAVLALALSLPFLLPTFNPSPSLHPVEVAAVLLWVFALVGESVSDHQLSQFKSDPANEGKVCDVGLWRYSRHPNYFFEWLVWVSFAVYALPSDRGWLALTAPALILFFLFRVTGIPATEAQSLRSRGDRYRRYQERTPAFFPWFPKEET